MRLRTILPCLLALAALFSLTACSRVTPTEARAIAAANNDHTAYTLPPEKLARAVEISRFYDTMYFVSVGWGLAALFLMLQLGLAGGMRDRAVRLSGRVWVQGYAFAFQLLLLFTLLALPLRIVSHRASVRFGFSVQHWGGWFGDQAKSFLVSYLVGGLFVMMVYYLVRRFPRRWWLALWFPTMLCVAGGAFLEPLVIDPLYYRFEPLSRSNPALVQQLEKVAAHGGVAIPAERMFLMKASAKTTTLNAYVTGFGASKRLVIWDTLLQKATPDEVVMIAGHEMGHYALGHVVRGIVISFFGILLAFFVGFHLFQWLLRRFGPRWKIGSQQDWAALAIMLLVLDLLTFFAQPIANAVSRGIEHDADVFGQEIAHGIVADPQAIGRATEQMLGEAEYIDPDPSAFVEFWTDSHPSTAFRAAFAKHYDPWAPGEEPKYFRK